MAQSNKRKYNKVKKEVKKQVKKMSPKSIAICCVVVLALVIVALVGAFIYNDCNFNKTKTFIMDIFYHQCRYNEDEYYSSDAYHWHKCSKCGEEVGKTTHTWIEDEYYSSDAYHWHKCSKCGEEVGKTTHTWIKDENSEEDGAYICTLCGKTKSISRPTDQTTEVEELEDLKIHFVDVGQGDCIIIEFPDGKNMIIDSGENSDDNEEAISTYASKLNITKFDYMLLTHQDSDHVGNMDYVFENFEIGYVFKPYTLSAYDKKVNNYDVDDLAEGLNEGNDGSDAFVSTSQAYFKFLLGIQLEGCGYESFNLDSDFSNKVKYNNVEYGYKFNFLTPTADVQDIKYKDPNDYSPICVLEYAGRKIMLTGDAEKEAENEYVEFEYYKNNPIDIDVLKVGHHGSGTSTTKEFLEAVKPEYAVICVGEDNRHYHPRQETLDRLDDYMGATGIIYRTDNNGDIELSISIDGNMRIDVEKMSTQEDNRIGGDTIVVTSFYNEDIVIIREDEFIFEDSKIKKVA